MALETKTIAVPLSAGMQDNADEFLIKPPYVDRVVNGEHYKDGVITKRSGFESLGGPSETAAPRQIYNVGDQIVGIGDGAIYRYNKSTGTWLADESGVRLFNDVSKVASATGLHGAVSASVVETDDYTVLSHTEYTSSPTENTRFVLTAYNADGALVAKRKVDGRCHGFVERATNSTAWPNGVVAAFSSENFIGIGQGAAIEFAFWDIASDSFIVVPGATAPRPWHGFVRQSAPFAFARSNNAVGTQVLATTYDITSGAGRTRFELIDELFNVTGSFDAAFTGDEHAILDVVTTNSTIYALFADSNPSLPSNTYGTLLLRSYTLAGSLNFEVLVDTVPSGSKLFAGSIILAPDGKVYFAANYDFGVTTSDVLSDVGTIVGHVDEDGDGLFKKMVEGAVATSSPVYLDNGDGLVYFPLQPAASFRSDLSLASTYTTIICGMDPSNHEFVPSAAIGGSRSQAWDWSERTSGPRMPRSRSASASKMLLVNRELSATASRAGLPLIRVPSESSLSIYSFSPSGTARVNSAQVGDSILLHGSLSAYFDGDGIREAMPFSAPEIISVEDGSGSSLTSSMTGGNALIIRILITYTDAGGSLHRSAPSVPFYVSDDSWPDGVTPPSPTARVISIKVAPPITRFSGEYMIEVYAGDATGGGIQQIGYSNVSPSALDTTSVTVTLPQPEYVSDGTARTLYTEGGVLASDPWPRVSDSVSAPDRIWAISADDKGMVFFSKLFEDGVFPEFNFSNTISIGEDSELTAIGRLDDKIVVFESDATHVVYGSGPSNTGLGQPFSVLTLPSRIGCIDEASVVSVPVGLIFRSRRGFYLLDRDLVLQYIGGGIEDEIDGMSFTRAIDMTEKGQVVFLGKNQDPTNNPSSPPSLPSNPMFTVSSADLPSFYSDGDSITFWPDASTGMGVAADASKVAPVFDASTGSVKSSGGMFVSSGFRSLLDNVESHDGDPIPCTFAVLADISEQQSIVRLLQSDGFLALEAEFEPKEARWISNYSANRVSSSAPTGKTLLIFRSSVTQTAFDDDGASIGTDDPAYIDVLPDPKQTHEILDGFEGNIFFIGGWNRALSNAEVRQLQEWVSEEFAP